MGIAPQGCRGKRIRFTRSGAGGVQLRKLPEAVLRRAGQPKVRGSRAWSWCVAGSDNKGKIMRVVFTKGGSTGLVASTARSHRVLGAGPGSRISKVKRTKRLTSTVRTAAAGKGARYVFGVRKGRITWIGVAAASVAKRPSELKRLVRLSKLK